MLPILERAGGRGRQGLLPRLRARARGPGQQGLDDPDDAEARRRRHATSACGAPSCSTGRSSTRWSRSRARWSPRRRSCTRTPSGRSTSRSRTSSRSCATSSGSRAWEVIEAASTKPFAFLPHYPGPGLGGDCIPVVPHFLAARAARVRLLAAADRGRARDQHAHAALRRAEGRATRSTRTSRPIKGSRLLLLGMAYKADVHDTRESPSFEVMRQLLARGGDVVYCDPWVPEIELDGVRHRERRVVGRRGRARRLRRAADRRTASSSRSRCGSTRA